MRAVIFVGIGTTAEQFALFLPSAPGLVAVTASLPIASLLGTRPVEVVVLGGLGPPRRARPASVRPRSATSAATGSTSPWSVPPGVSARWGITELDDAEAEIQRSAIEPCRRLVVIADGSKIGAAANAVVADAERIRTLVTDATAPRRRARSAHRPASGRS